MKRLETLKDDGGKAFVAYIMAGDGGLDKLRGQVETLQRSGVTAIEVGIPFSDPVADGPVIEEAGNRALKEGVTLDKVLLEMKSWDFEVKIPLIVMTYLNPVIRYGAERFAESCREAGVSAVIIPDLPFEHQRLVAPYLKKAEIMLVQLVTLTTTENRLHDILQEAEGFVYAVTVTGITGVRDEMTEEVKSFMKTVRAKSPVPVYAGFGISKLEHVDLLRDDVDGFVVGSAIVKAFHEGEFDGIQPLIDAVTLQHPV
ncbi:tryptophan synthase subunit alpha [Planococcus sp. CAU13]|uniref:tryptophan synthase subunit alpha n=1 Tax=Planococcus sp. CAU13 TaxID=1541197 RepID=UPI00052FDBB6|nr:tryptophan synthase subunit alpha [Planococcus sp. CAU13]